jgi:type II secretory ATPase GspE/PulE/Tfp pilus assembly ATPase PilB-like protein
MGIEPFLITSSINAVEAQRLVRRVCTDCRIADNVPPAVIDEIATELRDSHIDEGLKDPANWHFVRGQGCPNCHNGYRGRIGIFEVMTMSDELEALAVKKEPASALEAQAIKEGMITMKQDGLAKAIQGLTTVEEVMKATTE